MRQPECGDGWLRTRARRIWFALGRTAQGPMGNSIRRCASCLRFVVFWSRHPTKKRPFSSVWIESKLWQRRRDMNNSRKRLGRIYKIRQIEEDQARLGLESSVAVLRRTQMQVGEALTAE